MTLAPHRHQTDDLAECGWRTEEIVQPDGSTAFEMIPLTEEEFLHPEEGYHLPNSTFHDRIAGDIKDILTRRYLNDPTTAVFGDLIIRWEIANFKDHCPDTCVVFNVQEKDRVRTEFLVNSEGTRPCLVVEVVSPRYRKADREIKVRQYARAGVQEYIIFDRRRVRNQVLDEVLGYRLIDNVYVPITPDDEGRILCETVGLLVGLHDGEVVVVDAQTQERLLRASELEQWAIHAQQQAAQAQQRATQAEEEKSQAEQRASEAEQRAAQLAELLRSQGIDPDRI
ncbi:MAG: Uma2 family endonuclease [Oscillatoriales cyanobacterium RU_3_3]|nr:Uma2 family endonuclease [Microcoleus sp. SM1_3_4]NJM63008.1 Uma2 family endonuclease [Oscillatoriales cyanobacterium RU_3_3]NJR25303.1 Uma2 family endonuclease [Richelia sp. CSU_2_1]